ncbi:sulfite exporter TauE/SafE family protein [Desulfobacula phenolica]|uniref:Sulfite exporter TauE/SafE n=1 Tax=Desulfobacula phenolica TaxID=90732 RepID=A0A1H2DN03_9BACT|nr:sulfite exporter TauE/SafE family protein [Desulfobacula phenolica]SDT84282.1 Sulfite exporter TauE/SafE [Desulfobacula phenolica]
MVSFLEPATNGFLLGIATGPACFTSCVPVLFSVTLARGQINSRSSTWSFLLKFIGGRFIAYLVFGLAIGLLGEALGAYGFKTGAWATIVLSVLLIAYGMGVKLPHFGMCSQANKIGNTNYFPYVLGILTGLNVCPPFLLAISYCLQKSANPLFGVLFFLAFFLATTLYILPLGFMGGLSGRKNFALLGKIASIGVGIFFCCKAISILGLIS